VRRAKRPLAATKPARPRHDPRAGRAEAQPAARVAGGGDDLPAPGAERDAEAGAVDHGRERTAESPDEIRLDRYLQSVERLLGAT
jgi:hypothetical protein